MLVCNTMSSSQPHNDQIMYYFRNSSWDVHQSGLDDRMLLVTLCTSHKNIMLHADQVLFTDTLFFIFTLGYYLLHQNFWYLSRYLFLSEWMDSMHFFIYPLACLCITFVIKLEILKYLVHLVTYITKRSLWFFLHQLGLDKRDIIAELIEGCLNRVLLLVSFITFV